MKGDPLRTYLFLNQGNKLNICKKNYNKQCIIVKIRGLFFHTPKGYKKDKVTQNNNFIVKVQDLIYLST